MAEAAKFLDYHTLYGVIQKYCAQQKNGTLMLLTPDKKMARLVLDQGRICYLSFQTTTGVEAVPLIRAISMAQAGFKQDIIYSDDTVQQLPANATLLQLLEPSSGAKAQGALEGRTSSLNPNRVRTLIEEQLTEVIGPMAAILCNDYIKTPQQLSDIESVRKVLARLGSEIPESEKAQTFMASIEESLKRL